MSKGQKNAEEIAVRLASQLGHRVGRFSSRRETRGVRTAMCERCYGCCWSSGDGKAGGRIVAYECGTPEASGLLPKQ
jgi:hypothetical protein